MLNNSELKDLMENVNQIAQAASERIMEVYRTDFKVEQKQDQSPLTMADMAAHETIVAGLTKLTPDWPILSEESAKIPYSERGQWNRYWLVDPLDGTREFVKRNDEFTVNIALIDEHKPILGSVYVPVTDVKYFGYQGGGSFKQSPKQATTSISVRACPEDHLTIAGSRSHAGEHLQRFVDSFTIETNVITSGSSLKICLVAEGKADIYPRFGLTSEWDTAAAHCVVEQAGGHLTDTQLQPLRYNTKDSLLNPHFLVFGDTQPDWLSHCQQSLN